MGDFDKLVQMVTDRVLEVLEESEVQSIKEETKRIGVLGKKSPELNIFLEERGFKNEKVSTFNKAIVVTELSLERLVKISNMLPSSQEENFLLEALLNRRPVYILHSAKEYSELLDKCTYGSKQYIQSCENQWEKYGAVFMDSLIQNDNLRDMPRVITKEYLQKELQSGNKDLIINQLSIITPLAKDFIREANLNISYYGNEDNI